MSSKSLSALFGRLGQVLASTQPAEGRRGIVRIGDDNPYQEKRYRWGALFIGVGTAHWIAPPHPPNRTCGSPAYGSPVGGSPSSGLTGLCVGRG